MPEATEVTLLHTEAEERKCSFWGFKMVILAHFLAVLRHLKACQKLLCILNNKKLKKKNSEQISEKIWVIF